MVSKLPIAIKEKAIQLRKEGCSIKEISKELNIAQSTSSSWVRSLILDQKAKERLINRQLIGYYNASLYWQEKNEQEEKKYKLLADNIINKIEKNIYHYKLMCALLYWCEGSKGSKSSKTDLRFTNSDPLLIKTFLTVFRESFVIDESKFRVLMHLHKYHDEDIQKKFWSDVTKIPKDKFQKTYLKINSAKRIKESYQGCVAIKYYDAKIFKELKAIYKSFCENLGAW